MIELSLIHYTYMIIIMAVIVTIIMKKDVTLICIIGIGVIGLLYTLDPIKTIIIIYKAITISGKEFIEVVIIISIVNCMSKALSDIGADEVMISPIKKLMVNKVLAFFILGITMMVISWFVWPTPAVVFIGAIMVPAAIKVGLPRIWVAVVLCLFGKGAALSSDFFIQGAPATTAKTAGIEDSFQIVKASIPFWSVMCIFAIGTAFILMQRENRNIKQEEIVSENSDIRTKTTYRGKIVSVLTLVLFILDVIIMLILDIKGDEATALIGGTAVLILVITVFLKYGLREAFGELNGYIRDGFMFGMKIFAPIIVIGAFFFLGSEDTAIRILGPDARGLLTDVGVVISNTVPLSKITVISIQGIVSTLVGVSGSGFGGIPLVGTLAKTFANSIDINIEKIAAFGQVITIWIGGGTIIPWSVVPVAAICEVKPFDLARKNLIPVIVGVIATFIMGLIWI